MSTGTGAELLFLVTKDAERVSQRGDEWVSVRLLAMASVLLPAVSIPVSMPEIDVRRSLLASTVSLLGNSCCIQTWRRISAAEAMLAGHLVESYLAAPDDPGGRWTLDTWLAHAQPFTVIQEMQAAAWFNRLRLLEDELGTQGLLDHLSESMGWSGAVVAARDHPFAFSGAPGSGLQADR